MKMKLNKTISTVLLVSGLLFVSLNAWSADKVNSDQPAPRVPTQVFQQDAQLMRLYQTALQNNPSLAVFSAKEQAAFSQQKQAASYEKAQLQLQSELSYAWMKKKDFGRTANQLKASYPLYQPDKTDLTQAANFQFNAAQWSLEAQKQNLMLQVADLYYRYWSQQAQVEFLLKEKRSISSILVQVRKRFQVGYQNLNDIAEIQARLDNNQADLLEAKQVLAITESNLVALVGESVNLDKMLMPQGLPSDGLLKNRLRLPHEKISVQQSWFMQNPGLKALRQQEQAANRQVDYEKNKNGVQLDAFGAYVYNDSDGNFYDDMQGVKGGLELKYPLYLGGRTDAAVAKSRANVSQVQAQQRQLMLKLQAIARNSLLSYQAGIERLVALQAALSSNQEAVKATEKGLQTGTRNILDLLNAQRSLHKAQRDVPMTRAKIWQSWFEFYGALGLLQPSEVAS
ncbi:TolC family protein [Hydrogenovibrio kuenenii]|uniref:TolC family protein n=1 Tax=Hydrogenovibrio kuenenii TaxID=63658 RepID=UPI000466879C|nr:TolC family protein [Hydrogenovibrio kuenenii]